jgi:transposase
LRIRVIGAVEGGLSARGAARRLGVGESTATAWVGRWRRTGSSEAKSQKGRSRSPLAAHAPWLLALIAAEADLALEEIGERLAARGIQVAASSICWFYDRHGISFKKPCTPWQRPDLASARQVLRRDGRGGDPGC